MKSRGVARRYAQALMEIALAQDKVAIFGGQLRDFGTVYAGAVELRRCLTHPALRHEERLGVLNAVLLRLDLAGTLADFFRVVLERGRFALLPAMIDAYDALVDARSGLVRARVQSAYPLTGQQFEALVGLLRQRLGREVALAAEIVPELLGGMVVIVAGKVYDSSVLRHLSRIRDAITSA